MFDITIQVGKSAAPLSLLLLLLLRESSQSDQAKAGMSFSKRFPPTAMLPHPASFCQIFSYCTVYLSD